MKNERIKGEEMDDKLKLAVKKMAQGKEDGFNEVYSATYNHVFFRAKQYMQNEEDAYDLMQIVYVEAYKCIDTLQSPEALFSWLDGITYRQGMKLYRKKKDVLLTEDAEGVFDVLESDDTSTLPEFSADQKETAKIIREILEELPELQKVAIMAYYYDGYSVGQIAQMQECTEGTIKSRLNYGRKYIKARVEEREKKEGYRLHVVAFPLIWLALDGMSASTTLEVKAAQRIYNGSCSQLGIQPKPIQYQNAGVATTQTSTGIVGKYLALSTTQKVLAIAATVAVVGGSVGGVVLATQVAKGTVIEQSMESETFVELDTTEELLAEEMTPEATMEEDTENEAEAMENIASETESEIEEVQNQTDTISDFIENLQKAQIDGAQYSYQMQEEMGVYVTEGIKGMEGCIFATTADLDEDGEDEVVSFWIKENSENGNDIHLSIFDNIGAHHQHASDVRVLSGALGAYCDRGEIRFMIKDGKYVCVDNCSTAFLSADGSQLDMRVYTYDGEFVNEILYESLSGSDFYETGRERVETLTQLRNFGMEQTAVDMEQNDQFRFNAEGDGLELLATLQIENSFSFDGENTEAPLATCHLILK